MQSQGSRNNDMIPSYMKCTPNSANGRPKALFVDSKGNTCDKNGCSKF